MGRKTNKRRACRCHPESGFLYRMSPGTEVESKRETGSLRGEAEGITGGLLAVRMLSLQPPLALEARTTVIFLSSRRSPPRQLDAAPVRRGEQLRQRTRESVVRNPSSPRRVRAGPAGPPEEDPRENHVATGEASVQVTVP
ncbi:hypothetical protein PAMP_006650 [Pampus punctatissimus]